MDPRRRGPLVAALAVTATTAVIGVVLAGPLRVTGSPWAPPRLARVTHPPATPAPAGPRIPAAGAETVRAANTAILVVLGILVVIALAALTAWLVARSRRRRVALPRPAVGEAPGSGSAREDPAGVAAPVVRSALARALEILDRARTPTDAVVEAWRALEDSAAGAGSPRQPAETPSEYAARIVGRFSADAEAAERLRLLYERIRFGGRTADAEAVEIARGCLTILLDSWSAGAEPVRG